MGALSFGDDGKETRRTDGGELLKASAHAYPLALIAIYVAMAMPVYLANGVY